MQRDPRFRMVVALDLSEYAEIVLEHALDQAVRHLAPDIHIIHVADDERTETVETVKTALSRLVLEAFDNVGSRQPDWRVRLHVRAGRAHEEIVSLAADVDAHMIVCGRFGSHRAWRPLGTIAHRVLENAHCPVLAVNLVDRPIETQPQCPECVLVRAESDGERWFCSAHSSPDHVTLATTLLPSSTGWTGGGLLW
jgi:nucleotide-binding universal stress UspA family protein